MGNNKNQATLISFEQLNIYRSLFPVIRRPPSASPGPVLKPLRQKQQNAVWREMKKAVMLFKEWIKYSFQSPDCFSDWNVKLDNREENSPCLKNSDVSLPIISIHFSLVRSCALLRWLDHILPFLCQGWIIKGVTVSP